MQRKLQLGSLDLYCRSYSLFTAVLSMTKLQRCEIAVIGANIFPCNPYIYRQGNSYCHISGKICFTFVFFWSKFNSLGPN